GCCWEREFHGARAAKPDAGAAAQEIGRAEEFLGHSDSILHNLPRRKRVPSEDVTSLFESKKFVLFGFGGEQRVQAEQGKRRRLGVWPWEDIGAERCDPMSRLDDGSAQSIARHVADVRIAVDLHPSPTLAFGKNRDRLALESLGVEDRVGARLAPQHQRRRHYLARLALNITLGRDQTL